jgi:hypothetical protein
MATATSNYGLIKPKATDNYDIEVPNGNMDKIDDELKKNEDHRNDTAAHVTQAEHDSIASAVQGATFGGTAVPKNDGVLDFPICAQGNAFVWTATNVGEPDTNNSVFLTIPNFVFTEGCQVTFKATSAPSANNAYCCVCTWYALRKLDGSLLDGDEWVAGATVTVTLSNQSFNHPENWPTAFFKGGAGSIKELYDFPLSMQSSAPTPINTNHIWIQNDRKLWLTVDEAIRADWLSESDCYFAIVDTTDNNSFYLDSPKKLTDGTNVLVNNRHISRDWNNGYIHLSSAFPPAYKYGINYWVDNWIKPPRIYSRINGVVDMETAYRWDGSAWQYLSQKGHYVITNGQIWNRIGDNLSLHSSQSGFTPFDISKDGTYIITTEGYLIKRTGDMFNSVTQITTDSIYDAEFSPDCNYLAIGTNGGISIYKKQSDGNFAQLTRFGSGWIYAVCWSPTGDFIIGMKSDGWMNVYTRTGDIFTSKISGKVKAGSSGKYSYPCGITSASLQCKNENMAFSTCKYTDDNEYCICAFNPYTLSPYDEINTTSREPLYVLVSSINTVIYVENKTGYIYAEYFDGRILNTSFSCYVGESIQSLWLSPDEKNLYVATQYSIKNYAVSSNGLTLLSSTPIGENSVNRIFVM